MRSCDQAREEMMDERERLKAVAEIQHAAELRAEQIWNRAPFLWTVIVAYSILLVTILGAWFSLTGKVDSLRKDVDRNQRQIHTVNRTLYGIPDTAE